MSVPSVVHEALCRFLIFIHEAFNIVLQNWDMFCWASGVIGFLTLATVLFLRKRFKTFPWFTGLLIYEIVQTAVLYFLHSHGMKKPYFYTYWAGDTIETLIRVGVIFELARITAKHISSGARRNFRWITAALCIASVFCMVVVLAQPGLKFSIMTLAVKTSLCTSILSWALAFTLFLLTFFEGIRLRVHSQALAYGLVIYFSAKMLSNIAILGAQADWWASMLTAVKPVYILCLFAWTAILWFDEPKQVLNPEMDRYRQLRQMAI